MLRKLWSVIILCLIYEAASLYEGDSCTYDGKTGVCTLLSECQSIRETPRKQLRDILRCCFKGIQPIICCVPISATTSTTERLATTPPAGTTQTEYNPEPVEYTYEDEEASSLEKRTCPPLGRERTAEKTGWKAWDKCIDYQEQLMYPCQESVILMAGANWIRGNNCKRDLSEVILGSVDARMDEFPHMVLLGYEWPENNTVVWNCAGTLLSDRFILTAAHCTFTRSLSSPVMYAIVGTLRRSMDVGSSQFYAIQRIIKHPNYNHWTRKNDIALLETSTTITLGPSVIPACLDVFGGNVSQATVTSWAAAQLMGEMADTLQKTTLRKLREIECRLNYPVNARRGHFDPVTQLCYRAYDGNYPCQGSSGNPLTITNPRVHCMHSVIGVTSFGKSCGERGTTIWYTKVSHYINWIESIVWPDEENH